MAWCSRQTISDFLVDEHGSVAVQFALALLPLLALMGVAVDYSQATRMKAEMQQALDTAVLAGAREGGDDWEAVADVNFDENMSWGMMDPAEPIFAINDDGDVTGSLAADMPTAIIGVVGIQSVGIGVDAVATVEKVVDDSCLLTLGQGEAESTDTITFNGAPNITFGQCTIRSNTSMRCNGHSGGALASIAAGSATGCSNPQPGASPVPDIYAARAADINKTCAGSGANITWTAGTVPAAVTSVDRGSYLEYHACGNLTLAGNGYLTGQTPAKDSVIVIENGSLTIADNSNVSANRLTIILTGNNSRASSINFPNGAGKASVLTLSPPTTIGNPWRGISLYQDPILTISVDHDWGPGTTLVADGVVYLPNSDVTMRGNSSSNVSNCTKFVSNSFRTNGAVNISFKQTEAACDSIGVDQWFEAEPYLSQ